MPDTATAHALIAMHPHWYHRIEVAPGLITPGVNNSAQVLAHLETLGLPQQATGLRVLDIGCRDGFFSFELEKRGAEVLGVDYQSPTHTGFAIASELLQSRVPYLIENVYALSPEKHGTFDLVLFLGVLYHLRNPLLALDVIHRLCKPGALVFVETQLVDNCFLLADGTVTTLAQVAPNLENIPFTQFYPTSTLSNDPTNKWAPNMTGLKRMLEEAQFEILTDMIHASRGYVVARAISDPQREWYKQLDSGSEAASHSFSLNFEQAFIGSGWHHPETLTDHGAACWTGPETHSTLNIALAVEDDLQIKFRILMAPAPDILESLKLTVNDHPISLIRTLDAAGAVIFKGCIPQASLKQVSNFAHLTFEVNRTLVPNQGDTQNPDDRLLGVLFNWIEISPVVEADPISPRPKNSLSGSRFAWLRRLATRISGLSPQRRL